tara:strand:+ start:1454 stop:1618 length:165 start_codon:yes stop_codon:yes gene_type:complete
MKGSKLIIVGYLIGMLTHGCDSLIGSHDQMPEPETNSYERGCCEWNPIYVKVVD